MGPVSPGVTPSSAVFNSCWVWLAWAVGAGFRVPIAFRGNTSKRGIGCVNAWTPKSGLRGKPVGTLAYALRTKGFRPFFQRSMPPTVNNPHLNRSRRVTCPSASALMISWRFLRAFCASLIRSFDALLERNINSSFDFQITQWHREARTDSETAREAHSTEAAETSGRRTCASLYSERGT